MADRSRAAETLARAELCPSCAEEARRRGPRAVVTTTGKNRRGIVANIAQAIADAGGDIVDISQTLVSDYFTMIIVVDTSALAVPLADFKERLTRSVQALGAECVVMHEEIRERAPARIVRAWRRGSKPPRCARCCA